jgi:hypothetical protein
VGVAGRTVVADPDEDGVATDPVRPAYDFLNDCGDIG